jgi:signal transduction histidine kinase
LLRLFLACLLIALFVREAKAVEHIVDRAWLEDPNALLSPAGLPLQPMPEMLARGYGSAPVWVRLTIDPARSGAVAGDWLYLRARPAYLDELILYDPLQGDQPLPAIGDRYPFSAQPEPATAFVLRLPAGDGLRDVWVRVSSTSTRLAYFEVLDEDSLRVSTMLIEQKSGIYLGLKAMFALWGLAMALLLRDALSFGFFGYMCASLTFASGMLGYTRVYAPEWFPPEWIDVTTSATVVIATGMATLFNHLLLQSLCPGNWRARLTGFLLLGFPLMLGILTTGRVSLALEMNMFVILVLPLVFWLLAITSRRSDSSESVLLDSAWLPKGLIVGYLTVTMIFTVVLSAPALGLVRGVTSSLYVVLLYSITSALLMLSMLHYRAYLYARRQQALATEACYQRERARDEERRRLEREQLLDMLGHELRTPLALAKMVLANAEVPDTLGRKLSAPLQDIGAIVERTVQTGMLEDDAFELFPGTVELVELLKSVIGEFPQQHRIRFGRDVEAGDQAQTVWTDSWVVRVIVRNLIENALKYSPVDSEVTVDLMCLDKQGVCAISVSNLPGRAGWPDPARVFQKYYRSPKATHRSGSGLGLYLVRHLAATLGGDLSLEPDTDRIRFCFRFGVQSALEP